jgi:hypothetical protein
LLRGYIDAIATHGDDPSFIRAIEETTNLANMAAACGYSEAELTISWRDFLSEGEMEAVRCGAG